jgi:hypothetical protein
MNFVRLTYITLIIQFQYDYPILNLFLPYNSYVG